MQCSRCGFVANQPSPFCPACGVQTGFAFPLRAAHPGPYPYAVPAMSFEQGVSRGRGFGQIFGIHPAIAFLTLIVDMMLFGGEVATLGAILPVSIASGAVLGLITYLGQRKWYGDDKGSAFLKGLILAFLTAIPSPLPAVLTVPSGLVGLIHRMRKR